MVRLMPYDGRSNRYQNQDWCTKMSALLPGAVIFAKNVDKIAEFYRELFALSEKIHDAGKVVLESDHFSVVVHGIPEEISEKIAISVPPELRENTSIKLYLPVISIAEARQKASKFGGGIKPENKEWQAANFIACDGFDPEGNIFQVRQVAP